MNHFSVSTHSWLRDADSLHREIHNYIDNLPAKLGTPFKADEFCYRMWMDPNTHDLTSSQLFNAFKDIVDEKIKLSKPVGDAEKIVSLNAARKTKIDIETGKIDLNKITVKDVLERHYERHPVQPAIKVSGAPEETPHSNVAKPRSPVANSWEHITTGEKVNAGLWGVGAIMSVFGALGAARNSIARDDQDKPHIMWSQVGVCLLQAAAAAGCAYMGAQAFHGRSIG